MNSTELAEKLNRLTEENFKLFYLAVLAAVEEESNLKTKGEAA